MTMKAFSTRHYVTIRRSELDLMRGATAILLAGTVAISIVAYSMGSIGWATPAGALLVAALYLHRLFFSPVIEVTPLILAPMVPRSEESVQTDPSLTRSGRGDEMKKAAGWSARVKR